MKIGIFNYWLNYSHEESNGWRMSDDFEPEASTIRISDLAQPSRKFLRMEDSVTILISREIAFGLKWALSQKMVNII